MNGQLVIGTLITICMVGFHVVGLVTLARVLRQAGRKLDSIRIEIRLTLLLSLAVLWIIAVHTAEAWGWAAVFLNLGEFADIERALYFSVVTSTTLGYGDITLSNEWQLLGTFEAMGGLILFGASTAFPIGLLRTVFQEFDEPRN